jgi:hypothetical protein
MGFSRKKYSQKKRSRKHRAQKADSRVQAHEQYAPLERHPALPVDPLFDLFLAQQEQTHNQTLAKIKPTSKEYAIAHSISLIHRASWRQCERIFLSPGVTCMLDEILHDPEPYGLSEHFTYHLPSPAWIKIEEEVYTPFYEFLDYKVRGIFILKVFTPGNLALLKKQRFARSLLPTLDRAFTALRDFVTVQFVDAQGACLFKLEFQQSPQIWRIAGEHRCPYHACVVVAGRCHQPCSRCEAALDLFSRWFPICMLALQGRFRQIELENNPKAMPKRGSASGKTSAPPIRIVRTIDVSVVLTRRNGEGNMGREVFPRKGQDHAESKTNVHEGI